MTEIEPKKSHGWYYAMFFVFGILVGVGVTAEIIIPPINRALNDAQHKAVSTQANSAVLTQMISQLGECNATLGARNIQVQAQAATIMKYLQQPSQTAGIPTIYDAQSGTVIFEATERQVDVHLSLGMLHGLNLTNLPTFKFGPTGQMAPHWIIPGKVAPVFVGDSHGAVYYFFENNQWAGPVMPQPLPQQ
jgi:hypothetical protein